MISIHNVLSYDKEVTNQISITSLVMKRRVVTFHSTLKKSLRFKKVRFKLSFRPLIWPLPDSSFVRKDNVFCINHIETLNSRQQLLDTDDLKYKSSLTVTAKVLKCSFIILGLLIICFYIKLIVYEFKDFIIPIWWLDMETVHRNRYSLVCSLSFGCLSV